MARDRKAEAAARDARARAAGYSSYGQQYRAKKAGFTSGGQYRANVAVKRGAGIVRAVATGKLLGGTKTSTGRVVAADVSIPGQMSEVWRTITRSRDGAHVGISVQTDDGKQHHIGGRGGFSLPYLRQLVRDSGTFADAVDDLLSTVYGAGAGVASIVTVTIR